MEALYKLIIKWLANLKGPDNKFTFSDIEKVAQWVVEQDQTPNSGLEKAAEVVGKFNAAWGGRLSWIVKTVVQLCYALVQVRNLKK